MNAPSNRIAAIVLNYRTPELVIDCAETVAPETDPRCDRVIIVDNRSGDDSVARLRDFISNRSWPHVSLIESRDNRGFAAGNNAGIRAVVAEAYLLLNSDTYLRPGAVQNLYRTLMSAPDIGLCSPRLEWPDGTPQVSCFRFHTLQSEVIGGAQTGPVTRLLRRWDVPLPVQTGLSEPDWTSFAAVMIRREVFERVGELDEGFFMYYEDVDYCRRARQAGFRVVNDPAARVVHLRGGTSPVKEATRLRKRRPRYYYASRTRYFKNAYGPLGPFSANCAWTFGRIISFAREQVGNKAPHTVEREFIDNWSI